MRRSGAAARRRWARAGRCGTNTAAGPARLRARPMSACSSWARSWYLLLPHVSYRHTVRPVAEAERTSQGTTKGEAQHVGRGRQELPAQIGHRQGLRGHESEGHCGWTHEGEKVCVHGENSWRLVRGARHEGLIPVEGCARGAFVGRTVRSRDGLLVAELHGNRGGAASAMCPRAHPSVWAQRPKALPKKPFATVSRPILK